MFLNISNHPSSKWAPEQLSATGGEVVDIPFPNVEPTATTAEITAMAISLTRLFCGRFPEKGTALVQGEFSLCSELWRMLSAMGWRIVVATSERVSVENGDGTKTVSFRFVQFREIRGF